MSTGVLYIHQQQFKYQPYTIKENSSQSTHNCFDFLSQIKNSIKSVQKHSMLPITVFTDQPDEFIDLGVQIVPFKGKWEQCTDKNEIFLLSPYEQTIYLDCDTEVLCDPSIVFEEYGNELMVCREIMSRPHKKEWIGYADEFNAGVMFYRRSVEVQRWLLDGYISARLTMSQNNGEFFAGGDQRILNELLKTTHKNKVDWKYIPSKWNVRIPLHKVIRDPKIRHARCLHDPEKYKLWEQDASKWTHPTLDLLEINI